ncbi:unnamed protein product [Dovyalis caffra]|uniref:Uncharacterized protein n=1 Tax=Dovyalis caffra TaxID=77055 RepID=A0AAV1RL26_9ROSI|nr:unnamed protein product [Dovyalis caffra]
MKYHIVKIDLHIDLENVKYFDVDTSIASDEDLISVFKYYRYLDLEEVLIHIKDNDIVGNVNEVNINNSGNMNAKGVNMEGVDMNTDVIDVGVYKENVSMETSVENVNVDGVDVRERMEQVSKNIRKVSRRRRPKGGEKGTGYKCWER